MRVISKLIYMGIIVLVLVVGEITATEEKTKTSAEEGKFIAYYFHGTDRCPSCTKIEKWSYEAMKNSFPKALKQGRLLWKPVNIDKPENRHFIKEYGLFTKSLIITEVKGEKQTKWKNMDKVWQLLRDQEKFSAYVTQEVKKYLGN